MKDNAGVVGRVLTLTEMATALSRVCRDDVSVSKVRTMMVLGPGARALSPRRRGDRRLFTRDDLALAALLLRLRREGVSPVVSRVLVANWRDRLIEAWHQALPAAFGVIGMTGMLLWRGQRPDHLVAWIDLAEIWRGVNRVVPEDSSRPSKHSTKEHRV